MDYSKNHASVSSKIDTIEKRINGQPLPEIDVLEKDYQKNDMTILPIET